jgi:hypothetical protein
MKLNQKILCWLVLALALVVMTALPAIADDRHPLCHC